MSSFPFCNARQARADVTATAPRTAEALRDPNLHTVEELAFPMVARLVAINAAARARHTSKRSTERRALQ